MPKPIRTVAHALIALAFTGTALALPALDSQGKCRDNGRYVDQKLCVKPGQTKCRDIKTGQYAKCGKPGTEPVPPAK